MITKKLIRKFDLYLHTIGAEHSHQFIADGELIIRKNLPQNEPEKVKLLERGAIKFRKEADPFERCAREEE